MKKRDIKYIIKKVAIGVLIVLIVGSINKCNVKADTIDLNYYDNNFYNDSPTPINDYFLLDTLTLSDDNNIININIYLFYNNLYEPHFIKYYDAFNKIYVYYYNNYGGLNNDYDDIKFNIYSDNANTMDNIYVYGDLNNNEYYQMAFLSGQSTFLAFSLSSLSDLYNSVNYSFNNNDYVYYGNHAVNNNSTIYYISPGGWNSGLSFSYFYNSQYYDNFVLNSSTFNSIIINDEEQEIPVISSDFDININANYNVNNCNSLIFDDDSCILNNFFSTGLFINGIPYNINLYSDLTIYDNVYYSVFRLKNRYNRYEYGYLVFSPRQPDLRVVKVDINIDDNTGNLSYKFYNELGELSNDSFYVNSFIITSLDDIPDTVINNYNYTDLDSLKLSYSTDIFIHTDFNLNFFQSFDLYYSNITFINVNGTPIEDFYRLRTQAIMQEGINNGGSSWGDEIDSNTSNSNFLENLLNIVKLPFKFLNDTVSLSCLKLSLPIPFLNSTIDLPCMNSLYRSVLGNFYEIISIVINAFVLYRIGINVASTVKDIVDPTTDRIAVMDL